MTLPKPPTLKVPLDDNDHTRGPGDAAVTVVEYGDYQCPHCQRAAAVVEALLAEVGDRVRFAFRQFPLSKSHPLAWKAAEAAEAAAAAGKFWPMHHRLFAEGSKLDRAGLVESAGAVGLDAKAFEADLDSGRFADAVRDDVAGGVRGGVNGTPTFFVNSVRHNGKFDLESLRAAVDGAGNDQS